MTDDQHQVVVNIRLGVRTSVTVSLQSKRRVDMWAMAMTLTVITYQVQKESYGSRRPANKPHR